MAESLQQEPRDRPVIEITPAMVEAGVRAYALSASHDEMSFDSPMVTVRLILEAAISHRLRP